MDLKIQSKPRAPRRIPMSDLRREMILKVSDGNEIVLRIIHYMTRWSLCDDMLVWLVQNKLTGSNFLSWVTINWNGNRLMDMCKFLEMKVLKAKEVRPTIFGENWS